MKSLIQILSLSLCLVLFTSGFALANASSTALSVMTFKRLSAIEALLSEENFVKAQTQIDKLKTRITKLSAADQAYTRHMQALIYLYQEQYPQARKYFLSSYQQPGLNDNTKLQVLEMLASLAMHDEDYQQAIKFAKEYLLMAKASDNIKASKRAYLILASAYYQVEEYALAISPLKQVIKLFEPDKAAYSTLFAVYYQLKQLPQATEVVEKMIRLWPDKAEYWLQLASIYLEQDMYARSLEIMQLSFSQGFLIKQNELLQYIYALYEKNLPHKAATLLSTALEKSIIKRSNKNYNLLASLYINAKEGDKALVNYKKSSELSVTGEEDLYIAQIYFDQEKYKNSIEHAKKALQKGIKKPGNVHMLIAAGYHEMADLVATRAHLQKAVNYKETKLSANQWLLTLGDS